MKEPTEHITAKVVRTERRRRGGSLINGLPTIAVIECGAKAGPKIATNRVPNVRTDPTLPVVVCKIRPERLDRRESVAAPTGALTALASST